MDDWRSETRVAVDAVAAGLELALGALGESAIETKGLRDLVTTADVAVEDLIRARIGEHLGQPVIGEERGGEPPADGAPYWLVDPICGTTNFAYGVPLFCTNLALIEDGRPTIAVVGDGSRNEICIAELGRGARVVRRRGVTPLHVNDASQMVIVEESRSKGARRQQAARLMEAVVAVDRWDFRSPASSLSLPYLAAGRVAAYAVFLIGTLHGAAGVLLASEAGATLSDIDGHPWTLASDTLLAAATPALHEELLEMARFARPT